MKILDTNICLSNRKTCTVVFCILIGFLLLATSLPHKENKEIICDEEMWIPTEEDIAYQDSMYVIIQNTQSDITDIKEDIVLIIERLDYKDGTYDSIRYVEGGEIDLRRN